jgi:DNA-binding MarR family transcriptional regulator
MPLPPRQISVLRYLNDRKSSTTGNTARDLKMARRTAQAALQGLADKGLASKDHATFPASWVITEIGAAVLAAANERDS